MTQYDRLPALVVLVTLLCCGAIGSVVWARFGCACTEWRCRGCHVFGSPRNRTAHTTRRTLETLAARLLLTSTRNAPPEHESHAPLENETDVPRLPDVPPV